MSNSSPPPHPKTLRAAYAACRPDLEHALARLQRQIDEVLSRDGAAFTLKSRVKTFESYFEKALRLHAAGSTTPITDMLGLRIVCPFLDDIGRARELVTGHFDVIEIESKGADRSFREFGYDSLHLLVALPDDVRVRRLPHADPVCEIQIRTTLQDAWAEVEHELVYKASATLLDGTVQRKLAALNATLTLSDITFQEIRDYQREIRERGWERRRSLQEKIEALDRRAVLEDLGSVAAHRDTDPARAAKPRNRFERLVFDALEAHSGKRYPEAVEIYTRILAMKLPPAVRSVIYNHRGMARFVQSHYRQAIADFTRAIEHNRENLGALNNRGLARRLLHRYEDALRDFDRSLVINGSQADVYHGRALAHCDIGDFAKALEDCEVALSIAPGFTAVERLRDVVREKLFGLPVPHDPAQPETPS
jgi:putative GTP pyrophosphokinase